MTQVFYNQPLNEIFPDSLIELYTHCPLFAWITSRKENYQQLVKMGLLDNYPFGYYDVSINGFYLLSNVLRRYFKITPYINQLVDRNLNGDWNKENRIGIHIRMGDRDADFKESNPFLFDNDVESFIDCNILNTYTKPTIYLASDSTKAKSKFYELNQKYLYKISSTHEKAKHTSVYNVPRGPSQILHQSVADLLSIAQSDQVIGTQDSTFSIVAAAFQGKIPYLVAKSKKCYQPRILEYRMS